MTIPPLAPNPPDPYPTEPLVPYPVEKPEPKQPNGGINYVW